MESPKSRAIAQLMKDIMSKFIAKDLVGEEEQEGAEIEKEEHPQLGEGEAQDVAKQHLAKDPEAYEDEEENEESDAPKLSMAILAAKKNDTLPEAFKPKGKGFKKGRK